MEKILIPNRKIGAGTKHKVKTVNFETGAKFANTELERVISSPHCNYDNIYWTYILKIIKGYHAIRVVISCTPPE